ncbi:MAG: hypothetical protein WBB23_06845 [Desulforhopalus sp.]
MSNATWCESCQEGYLLEDGHECNRTGEGSAVLVVGSGKASSAIAIVSHLAMAGMVAPIIISDGDRPPIFSDPFDMTRRELRPKAIPQKTKEDSNRVERARLKRERKNKIRLAYFVRRSDRLKVTINFGKSHE